MRAAQALPAGYEPPGPLAGYEPPRPFVAEVILGGVLIHDVTITPEVERMTAPGGQLLQGLKSLALRGVVAAGSALVRQWRLNPATRFPVRLRLGGVLWKGEVEILAVVHGHAPKGDVEFFAASVEPPRPADAT